jgi:FAD-dependent monooxygenase
MDSEKAVYDILGGAVGSYPIKIDRILLKSGWRPNICIAESYASESRRIFLSGDAAHQNIPTGGHGINTAVGNSFDLGWKLAAALKGHGARYLLDAYEAERKPVAVRNIERSGVHHSVHGAYIEWTMKAGPGTITSVSEKADELQSRIKTHVLASDGENKNHGIEMGYRYNGSPVIIQTGEGKELDWNPRSYIHSTWPGPRPPHVFLADGKLSIFDLFGRDYIIVDFTNDGAISTSFIAATAALNIPLTRVHLASEVHVRNVWQHDAVLIRPDDHVAWRLPHDANSVAVDTQHILKVATDSNRPKYTKMASMMH